MSKHTNKTNLRWGQATGSRTLYDTTAIGKSPGATTQGSALGEHVVQRERMFLESLLSEAGTGNRRKDGSYKCKRPTGQALRWPQPGDDGQGVSGGRNAGLSTTAREGTPDFKKMGWSRKSEELQQKMQVSFL
jgi:hypothetical protein